MVKIINLVLYNDNDESYVKMYNILSDFYDIYKSNVTTFFYKYNNTIDNDIELIDNIIHIKGEETFVPGILEKTLIAFKYIDNNYDYDFIVRTNISTVINFNLLIAELERTPILYYGGIYTSFLLWTDIPAGIVDDRYKFTHYAVGTNIILSKNGCKLLITNTHLIDKTIIDDVAIGVFFRRLNIEVHRLLTYDNYHVVSKEFSITELNETINRKIIVYRNRSDGDRNYDVNNMKLITNKLKEI
jgi:hypothetical protein